MKLFTFAIAITITLASSQDVQFSGDDEVPINVETRADEISEDDVNSRIFGNIDLNSFAGNVAAAAVGSVVGNVGTNLASNYLSGCNNRGKRSVLMHKLEKRQAIEAAEKSGNAEADPVSTDIWILYILSLRFVLQTYLDMFLQLDITLILGGTDSFVLPTRLFEPRWQCWK
jgi:hypothetical protein